MIKAGNMGSRNCGHALRKGRIALEGEGNVPRES